MVGVEFLGDQIGELEFVTLPVADPFETDAERLQPVLPGVGQQRDDDTGIDPAGQQHPDRYVGDHPPLHRGLQGGQHQVLPVGLGQPGVRVLPVCSGDQ